MSILSLKEVSLSLKSGPLFERACLEIEADDRIGLIGQNGSGKSSLLSLLVKDLIPDTGEVAWEKNFSYSLLPQTIAIPKSATVASFLEYGKASEIDAAENGRGEDSVSRSEDSVHRGERSAGRVRHYDTPAISLENRYKALCRELGFADMDLPLETLSGGEKKKIALARALAPAADLLILDEPTNHLDIQTIEWLETRLQTFPKAVILVTHDRWFLDAVVSSIVEIDRHELRAYPGSYSQFLEKKASWLASLDRMENKRLANLKIELEWLNRGARARATKSERRKKEIEKMRESLIEKPHARIEFASSETRLGKKVCILRNLGLTFDTPKAQEASGDALATHDPIETYDSAAANANAISARAADGSAPKQGPGAGADSAVTAPRRLFENFSWEIEPGAKIGIVGPNGCGKTSLLKIIAGRLAPTEGCVELGQTVRMAVFEQTSESVDTNLSILEYIQEHAEHFVLPDGSALDAEFLLERFGFSRDFQKQKLRRLSGGELRRLMLVRVLAESPNFLLLDEPTNDLDIETIESLESYCADFTGSLLIVSHDRLLVDRLADELVIFDGHGKISRFHGSYLDWKLEQETRAAGTRRKSATAVRGPGKTEKTEATEWGSAGATGSAAMSLRTTTAEVSGGAPDAPQKSQKSKKAQKAASVTQGMLRRAEYPESGQTQPKGPAKLSFKEKQELAALLDEIDALETEKRGLDEFFQRPVDSPATLAEASRRYEEIGRLLPLKLARWEALASRE